MEEKWLCCTGWRDSVSETESIILPFHEVHEIRVWKFELYTMRQDQRVRMQADISITFGDADEMACIDACVEWAATFDAAKLISAEQQELFHGNEDLYIVAAPLDAPEKVDHSVS